jgi:hypothetical protein
MQAKAVLEHLQGMFPGRLVLYAPDLAKVLGLSERSLAHLIERGRFPFPVKTMGRRRCVDIFQVAEWLAANGDMPDQRASEVSKPKSARTKKSDNGSTRSAGGQSSIAKRLIEMRHRMSAGIAQMASACYGSIDRMFWFEVAEFLAMQQQLSGATVNLRWTTQSSEFPSAGEQTIYFDSASEAIAFARKAQDDISSKFEASISIRVDNRKIYQALKIDQWNVAVDHRGKYLVAEVHDSHD